MRPLISGRQSVVRRSDLRPLNAPSPLQVQADDQGRIVSVWRQGRLTPRTIAAVQDHWRIDDEWWREPPVSRMYYALQLEGDRVVTVYQDLAGGEWWLQRY